MTSLVVQLFTVSLYYNPFLWFQLSFLNIPWMQFHLMHLFVPPHSIPVDHRFGYESEGAHFHGEVGEIREMGEYWKFWQKYNKTSYLGAKFALFKPCTSTSRLFVPPAWRQLAPAQKQCEMVWHYPGNQSPCLRREWRALNVVIDGCRGTVRAWMR